MTPPPIPADSPRGMRDPAARAARAHRLEEPHIAPLTGLVREILAARPGAAVPWFDPESGGVAARILLLLEAPGGMAAEGPRSAGPAPSGFISLDNDDQSAQALFGIVTEAGLDRREILNWNIVPWYLGAPDHSKVRGATNADIDEGSVWLGQLIGLMPELRIAVLIGRKALLGWFRVATQLERPIPVLACPHPSPKVLGPNPGQRDVILDTLRAAARFAAQSPAHGPR